jgi:hypothetical protein
VKIGSLAYLRLGLPLENLSKVLTSNRDLFPSEVYDEYEYVAENGIIDYETFTQGPEHIQNPISTGKHRKKSGLLRVMKRGRCEKVDTFLNTLVRD